MELTREQKTFLILYYWKTQERQPLSFFEVGAMLSRAEDKAFEIAQELNRQGLLDPTVHPEAILTPNGRNLAKQIAQNEGSGFPWDFKTKDKLVDLAKTSHAQQSLDILKPFPVGLEIEKIQKTGLITIRSKTIGIYQPLIDEANSIERENALKREERLLGARDEMLRMMKNHQDLHYSYSWTERINILQLDAAEGQDLYRLLLGDNYIEDHYGDIYLTDEGYKRAGELWEEVYNRPRKQADPQNVIPAQLNEMEQPKKKGGRKRKPNEKPLEGIDLLIVRLREEEERKEREKLALQEKQAMEAFLKEAGKEAFIKYQGEEAFEKYFGKEAIKVEAQAKPDPQRVEQLATQFLEWMYFATGRGEDFLWKHAGPDLGYSADETEETRHYLIGKGFVDQIEHEILYLTPEGIVEAKRLLKETEKPQSPVVTDEKQDGFIELAYQAMERGEPFQWEEGGRKIGLTSKQSDDMRFRLILHDWAASKEFGYLTLTESGIAEAKEIRAAMKRTETVQDKLAEFDKKEKETDKLAAELRKQQLKEYQDQEQSLRKQIKPTPEELTGNLITWLKKEEERTAREKAYSAEQEQEEEAKRDASLQTFVADREAAQTKPGDTPFNRSSTIDTGLRAPENDGPMKKLEEPSPVDLGTKEVARPTADLTRLQKTILVVIFWKTRNNNEVSNIKLYELIPDQGDISGPMLELRDLGLLEFGPFPDGRLTPWGENFAKQISFSIGSGLNWTAPTRKAISDLVFRATGKIGNRKDRLFGVLSKGEFFPHDVSDLLPYDLVNIVGDNLHVYEELVVEFNALEKTEAANLKTAKPTEKPIELDDQTRRFIRQLLFGDGPATGHTLNVAQTNKLCEILVEQGYAKIKGNKLQFTPKGISDAQINARRQPSVNQTLLAASDPMKERDKFINDKIDEMRKVLEQHLTSLEQRKEEVLKTPANYVLNAEPARIVIGKKEDDHAESDKRKDMFSRIGDALTFKGMLSAIELSIRYFKANSLFLALFVIGAGGAFLLLLYRSPLTALLSIAGLIVGMYTINELGIHVKHQTKPNRLFAFLVYGVLIVLFLVFCFTASAIVFAKPAAYREWIDSLLKK